MHTSNRDDARAEMAAAEPVLAAVPREPVAKEQQVEEPVAEQVRPEEVAEFIGKSGYNLRYEGIATNKLEFTCGLCIAPAAHCSGVHEHMNNREHMNTVLNSGEEKYTDEEQAAFAE